MALPAANFPVMWVVVLVTGLNTGELPDIIDGILPWYIAGSFLFLLAIPVGIYFVVTQYRKRK